MSLFGNIKKALHDASVNISNTTHDAVKSVGDQAKAAGKNINDTAHAAVKSVGDAIGDKLGGGVAVHAINKINPVFVVMRGAILSMLDINLVGIATAMSLVMAGKGNHWKDLQQKWWMAGGEKSVLDSYVNKGKGKKAMFADLLAKTHGADGSGHYNATAAPAEPPQNVGQKVATAAKGLGVISGVLLAAPDPTGTTKVVAAYTGTGAGILGAFSPILKSFAKENGASAAEINAIKSPAELDASKAAMDHYMATPDAKKDELVKAVHTEATKIWGIPRPYFIGGAIVVGIGLVFAAVKLVQHIKKGK